ncbi:MAG: hypothetical protein KY432_00740 [Acidobacteria bacterium]|nr:hypothetical protein [Acidobacteriota bacterium]
MEIELEGGQIFQQHVQAMVILLRTVALVGTIPKLGHGDDAYHDVNRQHLLQIFRSPLGNAH